MCSSNKKIGPSVSSREQEKLCLEGQREGQGGGGQSLSPPRDSAENGPDGPEYREA